jgi:DNA-binding transcriptional LysR family regulator
MVNVRAVQAFVLIAQGDSFKDAASALHLTPSNLSKLIKSLERALGDVALVRRSRWGIELTDAGRAALRPARALLTAAHRLGRSVSMDGSDRAP